MSMLLFIICCILLFGADATRKGLGCLVKVILMGLALLFLLITAASMGGSVIG